MIFPWRDGYFDLQVQQLGIMGGSRGAGRADIGDGRRSKGTDVEKMDIFWTAHQEPKAWDDVS